MLSETTKLGIIGAGAFTDFSLGAYQKYLPNLELFAITDINLTAAEQIARKYNIETVLPSVEELLGNNDIKVVLILTPPNTHFELAKRALTAGKNVLVEKPIAFTVEQAQELLDLASANGLQMTANLVLRYHPFHKQLLEICQTKKYGALKSIHTQARLAEYPADHWYWDAKISGGFFLNTFCHFIDLYSYIGGEVASNASSTGSTSDGYMINLNFPAYTATLDIDLHATNDGESVTTVYTFENAIITTSGWMPGTMTTSITGDETTVHSDEKIYLYEMILSSIMNDLLSRIVNPNDQLTISHQDLLNAVRVPLMAEQNHR